MPVNRAAAKVRLFALGVPTVALTARGHLAWGWWRRFAKILVFFVDRDNMKVNILLCIV